MKVEKNGKIIFENIFCVWHIFRMSMGYCKSLNPSPWLSQILLKKNPRGSHTLKAFFLTTLLLF